MAEVSNLHRLNHHHAPPIRRPISNPTTTTHREAPEQQEREFSHRPHPFFDDYTTSFNFGFDFDLEPEFEDPNCFLYGEEDDEQMNFVDDLFESCETHVAEDPTREIDSDLGLDLDFESGFGPGLRVVGMDSESDSEKFEVNLGFVDNDVGGCDDVFGIDNSFNISDVNSGFIDNDDGYDDLFENSNNFDVREHFEWEEVDEMENLYNVIDQIEEMSVSSDISSIGENSALGDEGEEEARNLDWEVLLQVNNLGMFENLGENNNGEIEEHSGINLPEDYILAMEYDALFGQLVENENPLRGSPPASKSVVENLPLVVLTKEEIGENNGRVVCAVCKDEVAIGEKLIKMPCCHLYHGECIIPWLGIRNTCPVCRFELPTDDADYERRRS